MPRLQLGKVAALSEQSPDTLSAICLVLHHFTEAFVELHAPQLALDLAGIFKLSSGDIRFEPEEALAALVLGKHLRVVDDRFGILDDFVRNLLTPVIAPMRPRPLQTPANPLLGQ